MSKKEKISPGLDEDILTKDTEKHQIILYNDDVNTFQHVIETLVKFCKHTISKLNNVLTLYIFQVNVS